MTPEQEREMHELAVQLEQLTRGTGWEAMRYMSVGLTMERLAEYCAVCDCKCVASVRREEVPCSSGTGNDSRG